MLVFKIIIFIFYLVLVIESKRKQDDKKRIVGGTKADRSEFPFMASLVLGYGAICGASIFNETVVITAAHCVIDKKEAYRVVVGAYYRAFEDNKDGQAVMHNISQIIVHPCYKDETLSTHDIALFILEEPIKFNEFVSPIRLLKENEKDTKGEVAVAGWGKTEEGGVVGSDVLMKVTLKMSEHEECKTKYPSQPPDVPSYKWENNTVNEFMICAYSLGKGGPLFAKTEIEKNCFDYRQIGIVSFGEGCAREGMPGVYTDIYEYVCWILRGDWPTECSSTEVPPCSSGIRATASKEQECKKQGPKADNDKGRKPNTKNFGSEKISNSRLSITFGFLLIIFRIKILYI